MEEATSALTSSIQSWSRILWVLLFLALFYFFFFCLESSQLSKSSGLLNFRGRALISGVLLPGLWLPFIITEGSESHFIYQKTEALLPIFYLLDRWFLIGWSQADSSCVNVAAKQDGGSGSSRSHIMTLRVREGWEGGRWVLWRRQRVRVKAPRFKENEFQCQKAQLTFKFFLLFLKYWAWHFFECHFINCLTVLGLRYGRWDLLLLSVGLVAPRHVGSVTPPGIDPASPVLEGEFLTTGPPGNSSSSFSLSFVILWHIVLWPWVVYCVPVKGIAKLQIKWLFDWVISGLQRGL